MALAKPLRRYALWSIAGFAQLWMLLLMWGFSRGPASAGPYVTLSGCLVLVLLAAPLAPVLPKAAAIAALAGGLLSFAWPAAAIAEPHSLTFAAVVSVVPLGVTTYAAYSIRLWWTAAWLARPQHAGVSTIALSLLPLLLFFGLFHGHMLLATIFRPWTW